MNPSLDALITDRAPNARVSNAALIQQIQALHLECYGWALACCGNREDAEDLLQDVYVSALDNGLRFRGDSTLKTWIFGVIRQKARSRVRRERLRALLGVRHVARIDVPQPQPLPDEDALSAERRERTRAALAQLTTRQREVVSLVFYHDMSVEEAAKVMNVSIGSARTHYDRGKKKLAALLAGDR